MSQYTDEELATIQNRIRNHVIGALHEHHNCRCGRIEPLEHSDDPSVIALDVDGAPWFLKIQFS